MKYKSYEIVHWIYCNSPYGIKPTYLMIDAANINNIIYMKLFSKNGYIDYKRVIDKSMSKYHIFTFIWLLSKLDKIEYKAYINNAINVGSLDIIRYCHQKLLKESTLLRNFYEDIYNKAVTLRKHRIAKWVKLFL
jgi:hypothetical protein